MDVFGAFASIALSGEVLTKLVKDIDNLAVKLIRETGKELNASITKVGDTADQLIVSFFAEADQTIEFAIDRVAGNVQLLTGQIAGHAHLLVEKGGEEARLCIDHIQQNVPLFWELPCGSCFFSKSSFGSTYDSEFLHT